MSDRSFYAFWIIVTVLAVLGSTVVVRSAPETVEFYRTRPAHCPAARALDLPASWSTPARGGLTVWVCE